MLNVNISVVPNLKLKLFSDSIFSVTIPWLAIQV